MFHTRSHEGVKPYKCDTCDKTFTQQWHLKRHILIHDKVKHHACDYCDKRFTQNSSLKVHMRTHNIDDKPYICDNCGSSFSQKGNMERHLKICSKENVSNNLIKTVSQNDVSFIMPIPTNTHTSTTSAAQSTTNEGMASGEARVDPWRTEISCLRSLWQGWLVFNSSSLYVFSCCCCCLYA